MCFHVPLAGALVHFLLGDKSVKTEILDAVESKSLKKDKPHFEIGDLVDVHCRIREGDKERTQVFTGTVIARKGRGINETFTVPRCQGNQKRQNKAGKTILPPQANRQSRQARSATQQPYRLKINRLASGLGSNI
jgi:hypothetical protein